MEDRFQHTLDGQEVNEIDINTIATEASLVDDYVLSELFRLGSASPPNRGITTSSSVIQDPPLGNASVFIAPLRAYIGPISAANAVDAYKNARSVVAANPAGLTSTVVQFPAEATNRWDLVYVRVDVDVDGPSSLRFVKTSATAATQVSIVTLKQTKATIGRVQGTSAATPTKPSLPADSGSSYYIALGYVFLPAGHTLTTSIPKANIDEVAPVLQVSRATGTCSMRVASGAFQEGGYALANEVWSPSNGRPKAYLAPTMGGQEGLTLPLWLQGGRPSVPVNTTAVVDSSVDWRNRIFKVRAVVAPSGTNMPWDSAGAAWLCDGRFPAGGSGSQSFFDFVGNSFHDNSGAALGAVLADLNTTTTGALLSAGKQVRLLVDMSTGALKIKTSATDPDAAFFLFIEATGQFVNAF